MAGVCHLIVWLISIPLFFVLGLGIVIWAVKVSIAFWNLRKQLMDEQATAITTKMAAITKAGGPQPPQVS